VAAATVLDFLDSTKILTNITNNTSSWLEGVSSKMGKANFAFFTDLKAGKPILGNTDAKDGVDRAMVRFKQSLVQGELNDLKASNPQLYTQLVRESNYAFKAWGDASPPITATKSKLGGRIPDFANEADRRQIGYETIRQEAGWSCVQGGACNAQTLHGQ
jgi:hypothetical protein